MNVIEETRMLIASLRRTADMEQKKLESFIAECDGGGTVSTMAKSHAIEKWSNLINDIDKKCQMAERRINYITKLINSIDCLTDTEKAIVIDCHINGMSLKDIALYSDYHYSYWWIRSIHAKALDKLKGNRELYPLLTMRNQKHNR